MKTEQELIDSHRNLLSIIEEVKLDIVYGDQNGKRLGAIRLMELESELTDVEKDLCGLSNKVITEIKSKNVLRILKLIRDKLKLSNEGYSISPDQGTIDDNYIYGCVISDILNAFDVDFKDNNEPNYYYDTDKQWDHFPLKNLIEEEIVKLSSNPPDNYVILKDVISKIHNRIQELGLRKK